VDRVARVGGESCGAALHEQGPIDAGLGRFQQTCARLQGHGPAGPRGNYRDRSEADRRQDVLDLFHLVSGDVVSALPGDRNHIANQAEAHRDVAEDDTAKIA